MKSFFKRRFTMSMSFFYAATMRLGYCRSSLFMPDPSSRLRAAGCSHVYFDVGDGAARLELLAAANSGDAILVPALADLGFDTVDLVTVTAELVRRGIDLYSLDDGQDGPIIRSGEAPAGLAATEIPEPLHIPSETHRRGRRGRHAVAREVVSRIAAMRADGRSFAEIGRALGIHRSTAHKYAAAAQGQA